MQDSYFWVDFGTFESSIISGDSRGSIENWLEPKIKPPSRNLVCPNP